MDNKQYNLHLESVTKVFSRRTIFREITAEFTKPGIYGIAGSNGTGKSTLVKTIGNIITPSSGKVRHLLGSDAISEQTLHNYIGFLSPYLVFYEEFSAIENIRMTLQIRGLATEEQKIQALFEAVKLNTRQNDLVKTYSSGMKQRLKLIFALSHSPSLLILDEPTSNLDDTGKEQFYTVIKELGRKCIVLIASNEKSDLELCSSVLNLEDYK